MKQINIIKNNIVTNSTTGTQEEVEAFLAKHESMKTFGEPAYSYQQETSPAVLAEDGTEISPAVTETVNVPAEYEVQIVDTSAQDAQDVVNATALAYLASTDWMQIRASETGTPVPQEILTARATARASII